MPNVYESGYTQLLNYGGDSSLELGDLDDSGGSVGTLTDSIGSESSDMLTNLTTDEVASNAISGGKLVDGIVMEHDTFIKSEGVIAYNNGTGYYLGWDETLATYVFFIGNSSGNKLTWDGTTLAITGTITASSGTIGGWTITSDTLYSLASGTPSSSPNNGVVLDSSNPQIIIYEGLAKRVEVGFLSAGVFGVKGYATDGTTVIFEFSDTQQMIAGLNFTDTFLYELATGTPSSSPNDGLVIESGSTPRIIAYEDTEKRTEFGYLAAGIFGIKGYATDGTTVLFELSDSQNFIAGWTISSTTLANSTNIILDASAKAISLNSATFGADGIQLQYNTGNPRAYIGDGANQFFQFDGTNVSWDGSASSLSTAGKLTTTSATIGGWEVIAGFIYNLQSGTPSSSPNDGIVLASGNEALIVYEDTAKRVEVGFLSAGIYGLKVYDGAGSVALFEISDTKAVIADWTIVDGYLYGLASGTPTSTPNDGVVLKSGSSGGLIVYEDTAKRVEVGFLSAGIYGIKGYATNGTTVLFELSDTQVFLSGFTLAASTLTATNFTLDTGNQKMSLGTGNDIIILDAADTTYRLAIGNATYASAPFRVTKAGAVTAADINLTTAVQYQGVTSGITGTELETLSSGATSNADALHTHNDLVTSLNIITHNDFAAGFTVALKAGGFSDATTKLLSVAIFDSSNNDSYVMGYQCSNDIGAAIFFFDKDRDSTATATTRCAFYISTDYWAASSADVIEKNGTAVTISGGGATAHHGMLGHDPTNSYLLSLNSTTNIKRFSGISGTTITFVDNITLDTAVTDTVGFLFDNTNSRYICVDTTNNVIRRFNSSGTTIDTVAYTITDTNVQGVCFVNDRVYLMILSDIETVSALTDRPFELSLIPTTMTR